MNAVPEITEEQRLEALGKAKESRRAMAGVKRALKAGEITFAQALGSEAEQPMRALRLVESAPGYGKARAAELMRRLRISPTRRVRGLGPRQREALLEVFE